MPLASPSPVTSLQPTRTEKSLLDDVARGEAAEKELNAFIERRALGANAEQERVEDLWRASELAQRERRRRENRALWYAHEMRMCELHEGLAAEHEAKARALLGEGAVLGP